jgi:hypothetical protein
MENSKLNYANDIIPYLQNLKIDHVNFFNAVGDSQAAKEHNKKRMDKLLLTMISEYNINQLYWNIPTPDPTVSDETGCVHLDIPDRPIARDDVCSDNMYGPGIYIVTIDTEHADSTFTKVFKKTAGIKWLVTESWVSYVGPVEFFKNNMGETMNTARNRGVYPKVIPYASIMDYNIQKGY